MALIRENRWHVCVKKPSRCSYSVREWLVSHSFLCRSIVMCSGLTMAHPEFIEPRRSVCAPLTSMTFSGRLEWGMQLWCRRGISRLYRRSCRIQVCTKTIDRRHNRARDKREISVHGAQASPSGVSYCQPPFSSPKPWVSAPVQPSYHQRSLLYTLFLVKMPTCIGSQLLISSTHTPLRSARGTLSGRHNRTLFDWQFQKQSLPCRERSERIGPVWQLFVSQLVHCCTDLTKKTSYQIHPWNLAI